MNTNLPMKPYINYNRKIINNARKLRSSMTEQERKLWYLFLRTYPVKFYRQRTIGSYVVDFACVRAHLVIEVDGGQHYFDENLEAEKERTEYLETHGLKVIRFTNKEVDEHFESVFKTIDTKIKERINTN